MKLKQILNEVSYNQIYSVFKNELKDLKRFPPKYFAGLLGAAVARGIEITPEVIKAAKEALLDRFGQENDIEKEFTEDGWNWFNSLKVGHYPDFNGKIWED